MGQNICQHHSIWHRLQDKHVSKKWQENDFWGKLPIASEDTKNFIEIALAHSVSEINAFYTEIQDGRQKWG